MLVGIAIVGIVASEVSAGNAICKAWSYTYSAGKYCTVDTGNSCVCATYVTGADEWWTQYGDNWCYNYHATQWYTEW